MADEVAATGRLLSGEFGSPNEVLAADALSASDKRQILEHWLRDLDAQAGDDQQVIDLRLSIETALADLEHGA